MAHKFRQLVLFGLAALTLFVSGAAIPAEPEKDDTEATIQQLEIFAEVFAAVREEFVEDVDDATLIEYALNGTLESLDPHSHYVAPTRFEESQKNARREYGGLGIEVVKEDGLVKINYVIPDGPAGEAGIKRNDYITAVEGESVIGKTLSEAVEGMRGLAGEPITISVQSPGEYTREVEIIRQVVQGRAVHHSLEDGIGYMLIETFNHPRLTPDVQFALNDLKEMAGGELPGLIIDVRGNPGGLVEEVVSITGMFLDGGEVFSARGRDPVDTQRYNAEAGDVMPGTPIVVLINSRSASAAEILAGAIQDRGRGIVVGRRSFGKGSVQSVVPLTDGGALRLTTQRYYTPSGQSIQGRGIMPDVLVAIRPDDGDDRRFFREDSFSNALLNPDTTAYEEDKDEIIYPDSDWPVNEDFQLHKAKELVRSAEYKNLTAEQNWQ